MERILRTVLIVTAALAAACAPRERTLVLLSTNDMHAKIRNFPRLAAAVEACRDTAQLVVLVDAGDRWTGNAYVDRAATPGMPMIALMNRLGYDVATLGNHEFDHGQAFLGRMIDSMDFEVVCANVVSDTCSFPPLPPYTVLEEGGFRIGFVGVVTNYEGPGHPAGNASSFAGLTFPDPQQMALKYAAELRPKCDVLVLVSHMGDDRDRELLAGGASQYDVVIGGHTHEEVDTLIGGTLLTQTGKDLRNIGVTTIRMKGRKVAGVDFRLVPLAGYEPDPVFQKQVDACYANPELNRPMGEFGNAANKWGLANWMAGAVAEMKMTPADMRRMIVSKYNDPVNVKEAHRIDLISTTPYVIVTDQADNALDVEFPKLREGKVYTVAVSDYVYKNYNDLNYTDGKITEEDVTGLLLEELEEDSPLRIDNTPRQRVRRK